MIGNIVDLYYGDGAKPTRESLGKELKLQRVESSTEESRYLGHLRCSFTLHPAKP